MPFGQDATPVALSRRGGLIAAAAALLLVVPVPLASAQNAGNGKNITKDVQQHVTVALPSLNPLVQLVSPAVVNISAQRGRGGDAGPLGRGTPRSVGVAVRRAAASVF